MWSAWYSVDELREKFGLTYATLDRWAQVGYAQLMMRKPDGLHEDICARIRDFVGANVTDELKGIAASVAHAERCGLKAGEKA